MSPTLPSDKKRASVAANDLAIRKLKVRATEYEVAVKEHRGLVVRVHPSGRRTFILRYRQDGILKRVALQESRLSAARAEWEHQRGLVRAGQDPAEIAKGRFEAQQRARAAERAARFEREAGGVTLADLCIVYCDHLKARGKVSAGKVRSDLERHVISGPKDQTREKPVLRAVRTRIGALLARDVTRTDVAQLIRAIAETGARRAAGIVRSYLKAAYTLALAAEGDAEAPSVLIGFRITSNPVADIKAIKVKQRHRNLTTEELQHLLKRLKTDDGITADAIRLCLLAGGQRPQQVLRATVADYRTDSGELVLHDAKGKRDQPRIHVLPLAIRGRELASKLRDRAEAMRAALPADRHRTPAPLFSTHGKTRTNIGTLSRYVTSISNAMVWAGEAVEPFQMKDLRRTVETMMAAMKVTKDVRAQVLSHGISGVQATTYDRHGYDEEKRRALRTWERRLAEIEGGAFAKVVAIR